jgi:hypothetical protein
MTGFLGSTDYLSGEGMDLIYYSFWKGRQMEEGGELCVRMLHLSLSVLGAGCERMTVSPIFSLNDAEKSLFAREMLDAMSAAL